jgi:hypothetical protein
MYEYALEVRGLRVNLGVLREYKPLVTPLTFDKYKLMRESDENIL